MGNCCGKPDAADNFSGPGRPVGVAPPARNTSSVPAATKPRTTGPGRTLGGAGASASAAAASADDARRKAADAAQARNSKKPAGKLGAQLEAQKKMTDRQALEAAAKERARQREIDNQAGTLSHD